MLYIQPLYIISCGILVIHYDTIQALVQTHVGPSGPPSLLARDPRLVPNPIGVAWSLHIRIRPAAPCTHIWGRFSRVRVQDSWHWCLYQKSQTLTTDVSGFQVLMAKRCNTLPLGILLAYAHTHVVFNQDLAAQLHWTEGVLIQAAVVWLATATEHCQEG